MLCFINGSLFTEILPLCGCWTFLKANKSLGFRTCCSSLWTCVLVAVGQLHEVFCTGSAFTCTGFACFADVAVITGAEELLSLALWELYQNHTGTVLHFAFSICHLVSETHTTHCLVYHSLYHSLC